jgi:O-antigen/teichoic acid export membrane protein
MNLKENKIFLNILGGSFAKAANIVITLMLTPLLLNYLGNIDFGIFSTIYSFYIINNILDLGLGMYLQNKIPDLHYSEDKSQLRRAISTVFFALVGIAFFSTIIFLFLEKNISWNVIFKSTDTTQISKSIRMFVYCWVLYLPFSIVQKIRIGFQESYKSDIWITAGNILGLILCFVFVKLNLSSEYFILAIFGSNSFVNFIHFTSYFYTNSRQYPTFKYLDNQILTRFLKEGFVYFILQTSALILITSDSILIAYFLNVSHVTTYTLIYRIFGLCILPISLTVSPIFYALNDAFARNDLDWIRTISQKTLRLVIPVSVLMSLILVFSADTLVSLWTQKAIIFPLDILLSFGWLVIVFNVNMFVANFSNTIRYFKKSFKIYPFACLVTMIAKIIMIQYWGISGLVFAYGIFIPLFYFLPFFRIFIKDKILG